MLHNQVLTRTSEFIQYLLFRLVCFLLNMLPFAWAMQIGKIIGRFLYCILKHYRKMAIENLRFVFGDQKTDEEIQHIARASFENIGYFAIEVIRIPEIVKNLKHYVTIQNEEPVFRALEKGKGVVLIVSHFGNWEWMGVAAGARVREKGAKINAVARALGNPFLYRYLTENLRGATGLNTINKKGATKEVMRYLDQNEIVCILIDQHERYGSVPVPYFGRTAWTTSLPARMALLKETTVIPVFAFRRLGQSTVVELGKPFPTIDTGDYESDIIQNTAQYIRSIEEVVRKRPGDWLWMHARWRESQTAKITK